jgi:hypothetical protein
MFNVINRSLIALIFLSFSLSAWSSDDFSIRSGLYHLTARTIMPNLEENLRYAETREDRCLQLNNMDTLFPILQHESFAGCRLGDAHRQDNAIIYLLNCRSNQVATGVARLEPAADRISGELNIQMGGKNMTFSQRIEATWQQDCAPE